jgi:crossover junction endodeoxyribonuclease RusA
MKTIEFFTQGTPKGQPRPKAFSRGGHAGVYDPGTANEWKLLIRHEAQKNAPESKFSGPVRVTIHFYLPRPKAHFLKSGLRGDAPVWVEKKPDADNLAKAVMDALTDLGSYWADDSQVTQLHVTKRYASTPGALLIIGGMES